MQLRYPSKTGAILEECNDKALPNNSLFFQENPESAPRGFSNISSCLNFLKILVSTFLGAVFLLALPRLINFVVSAYEGPSILAALYLGMGTERVLRLKRNHPKLTGYKLRNAAPQYCIGRCFGPRRTFPAWQYIESAFHVKAMKMLLRCQIHP